MLCDLLCDDGLRVFAEIDFRNRFLKSITFYNKFHGLSIGNFEDFVNCVEIDNRGVRN